MQDCTRDVPNFTSIGHQLALAGPETANLT